MFIGAQERQLFDSIIAKNLILVDEDSNQVIITAKGLSMFKNSKPLILLGQADDGSTGYFSLFNNKEKEIVIIGNDGAGGGHLMTANQDGEGTVFLGTEDATGGGRLITHNIYGNKTSYVGTFEKHWRNS